MYCDLHVSDFQSVSGAVELCCFLVPVNTPKLLSTSSLILLELCLLAWLGGHLTRHLALLLPVSLVMAWRAKSPRTVLVRGCGCSCSAVSGRSCKALSRPGTGEVVYLLLGASDVSSTHTLENTA